MAAERVIQNLLVVTGRRPGLDGNEQFIGLRQFLGEQAVP